MRIILDAKYTKPDLNVATAEHYQHSTPGEQENILKLKKI